jgi:hypothetical protein
MSAAEHSIHAQRSLPLEVSARCTLVTLEFVRNLRGCDAESVRNCVGDATHPNFLRWVFNLAVKPAGEIRELRFWKSEILGPTDKWAQPAAAIAQILGARETFPRGEIEVAWTINATTISRLVRTGEIEESPCRTGHHRRLTRRSLAAFLARRLQ